MKLILLPLRIAWSLFVVLTPLLGVWVASSLAIYLNGPLWAACLVGALLFPVMPLLWDWRASSKFRSKQEAREKAGKDPAKRWLTFWDRMTLRTLVLNLSFLGILLATFPAQGFTALSTRGDWMLAGKQTSEAETTRKVLFATASGLEWLHELSRDNPYEREDADSNTQKPEPTPEPNPLPLPDTDTAVADNDKSKGKSGEGDRPADKVKIESSDASKVGKRQPGDLPSWPMGDSLHPVVANMPESVKTSPEAVAKYIAEREKDPFLRVKALHDFVADRIAYDVPLLSQNPKTWPSQKPDAVFKSKKAVCMGYAQLLEEMGRHTGDEIVYVVGVSRGLGGEVSGGGHAWNAAKVEGRWYLIDATWNAGNVNGTKFEKSYGTRYLFTPPNIFGVDHFPDNEHWQLRKDPISRGEFVRQPMLKPGFYANGFKLISPKRSQVSTGGQAVIELERPIKKKVIASIVPKGQTGSNGKKCEVKGGEKLTVTCDIPSAGTYQVWLFGGDSGPSYGFVGQVEFVSSGA